MTLPRVLYDNAGIPRDEYGNEVFPLIINMICPIQYADQAREFAAQHVTNVEGAYAEKSHMLRLNLGPIGTKEITHIGNTQRSYSNILALRVTAMKNTLLPWIATKSYTVDDNPDDIKSYFCCIVGNPASLLIRLKLAIIAA